MVVGRRARRLAGAQHRRAGRGRRSADLPVLAAGQDHDPRFPPSGPGAVRCRRPGNSAGVYRRLIRARPSATGGSGNRCDIYDHAGGPIDDPKGDEHRFERCEIELVVGGCRPTRRRGPASDTRRLPSSSEPEDSVGPAASVTHVVVSGEHFWSIAERTARRGARRQPASMAEITDYWVTAGQGQSGVAAVRRSRSDPPRRGACDAAPGSRWRLSREQLGAGSG